MKHEKTIDVLNTVIEINNDRIEGYETALKETEEAEFKSLFAQFAYTSQKCNSQLIDEVQKLGGTPAEGTKVSGKFFRVWMDVKAALTGNDREAILNSCEYGEEVAQETYENALNEHSDHLTSEQKVLLRQQLMWLKAEYDTVKSMIAMSEQD